MTGFYTKLEGKKVRALSVQWPWSEFLASGVKRVENRTRLFGINLLMQYIFIHTSKNIAWSAFCLPHVRKAFLDGVRLPDDVKKYLDKAFGLNWRNGPVMKRILEERGVFPADIGKIVALVQFKEAWEPGVNKLTGDERIWRADDQYGLFFPSAHRLRVPVATRGALGFWKFDATRFGPADIERVARAVAHNEGEAA